MTSTRARMIMVGGAFIVMGGVWLFKGWQLDRDAEQGCATMIEGYRQVIAEQGEGAVDGLKFAIQARQYAGVDDEGACGELRKLAKAIEAAHDAKARPTALRDPSEAATAADDGPAPELSDGTRVR